MADYTKFTVTSKRDTASGAYSLEDYDKDLQKIRSAIKSALPEDVDFLEGNKSIAKSGRMSQAFYVPAEYATQINKMLKDMNEKLVYDGGDEKYNVTRARKKNTEDEAFIYNEEKKKYLASKAKEKEKEKENKELSDKPGEKSKKDLLPKSDDKEDDNKDKGSLARANSAKSRILKIIAGLTIIINVLRRILSSVLAFSAQTYKDMTEAHNLGLSYEYVRQSKYIEKAHGMDEGTIIEAVSDVQNKFGNITKLDESALNDLALVMGGKVKDLVKSGIGASDPDKLLGTILDTFNEKANAGYNSVGEYVGEQQARRELYSYLQRISPAWANIFATMQEEQHNLNSIFRNQSDTWQKLRDSVSTDRNFGAGQIERNVTAITGQTWNLIQKDFQEVKDGLLNLIAPALLKILRWVHNLRVGLDETAKLNLDIENRETNRKEIERVSGILSLYEGKEETLNPNEFAYLLYMKQYLNNLIKENEKLSGINDVVLLEDEIRRNAKGMLKTFFSSPGKAISILGEETYDWLESNGLGVTMEEVELFAKSKGIDLEDFKKKYKEAKQAGLLPEDQFESGMRELEIQDEIDKRVKAEYKKRIEEESKNGKVSRDRKKKIKEEVERDIEQQVRAEYTSPIPEEFDEKDFIQSFIDTYFVLDAETSLHKLRAEKVLKDSETGNRVSVTSIAYDKLIEAMGQLGAGSYVVSSEQVKNGSGEIELRIRMDFKDAKGHTESRDFGSYRGESGFTGISFSAEVGTDGTIRNTDTTAIVGTGASGGAK